MRYDTRYFGCQNVWYIILILWYTLYSKLGASASRLPVARPAEHAVPRWLPHRTQDAGAGRDPART